MALPFGQDAVGQRGHAIECRVYAENPANDFYPSVGTLLNVIEPRGPGVRVDAGFEGGDSVSQHYDALLAKVVAHAATRAAALARMRAALAQFHLLGLTTNVAFLRAMLAHPEFEAGRTTTRFVEEHFAGWRPEDTSPTDVIIAAALREYLGGAAANGRQAEAALDPWGEMDGFRLGVSAGSAAPSRPGQARL